MDSILQDRRECYLCRRFDVVVKVYCLDIIVCYRLFCIRRRCAKSGNYHAVFLLIIYNIILIYNQNIVKFF